MTPPLPRLRLYIAVSVDGFIADRNGGVEWLRDFDGREFGYDAFIQEIGTVIMGRKTYEQTLGFGQWPYPGKRVIVFSSRELIVVHPGVERHADDPSELVARLRSESEPAEKDIWLAGGAETIRHFLDRHLIDELELYVIPVLLGRGIPLFCERADATDLRLVKAETMTKGVVRLVYRPDRQRAAASAERSLTTPH